MISIPNKSTKETLHEYLLQYQSIFKKPSYFLFTWLITAMLYNEEVRRIKFLYDNFIKKYYSKSHFLSYANLSCESLLSITVKIVLSLIPLELKSKVTILLTTDDTLQSKFGKKFDCYFHIFDLYSIRWNIEVIFYQQKFFWPFGNYMVRNKLAIERYVNLISISFAFV